MTTKSFSTPAPPESSGSTANSKYPSSAADPTLCVARTKPRRRGVTAALGSGAAPLLWCTLNSANTLAGAPPVHSQDSRKDSAADVPGFSLSVATVTGAVSESVTVTLLETLTFLPPSSIMESPPTYVSPPTWYPPLTYRAAPIPEASPSVVDNTLSSAWIAADFSTARPPARRTEPSTSVSEFVTEASVVSATLTVPANRLIKYAGR